MPGRKAVRGKGWGRCICCEARTNASYQASFLCPDCKKRYLDDWGPVPRLPPNPGVPQGVVDFWKRWWQESHPRKEKQ